MNAQNNLNTNTQSNLTNVNNLSMYGLLSKVNNGST
jgi:hypothetical protein